jgi:hypothetical protein
MLQPAPAARIGARDAQPGPRSKPLPDCGEAVAVGRE